MIFPNSFVLRFIDWIATRLGLNLRAIHIVDSLDEKEVADQLHYGRD